ncbi:MAG: mechanosensitive ion channel family protein [Woeseiaceae bacterium]
MSINARFSAAAIVVLSFLVFLPTQVAMAQESEPTLQPLPAEMVASFESMVDNINYLQLDIETIDVRLVELEDASPQIVDILNTRRDKTWTAMFDATTKFAMALAAQQDRGFDVSEFMDELAVEFGALPAEARVAADRIRARGKFPNSEDPPSIFVFEDQGFFQVMSDLDDIYEALISYTKVAERFNLDTEPEIQYLTEHLEDSAENRAIWMEIALNDVSKLRASVATLPNDTSLSDWLAAAQTRVQMSAASLQDSINLMNQVGLETRRFRQMVLTVTGEITTDILDVGIVANLLREWGDAIWDLTAKEGPRLIFRLLLVALIVFVFFQLSKLVQKGVEKAMSSSRNRMSYLLRRMITSSVRNIIMIFGILIGISQLGISLAPLLAGLGIAGFIIGFALQDSLSNFASGIMILMYRPFDVGDVVDAAGVRGRVSSMSLVNTSFMTLDNQRLVVPNNMIWQSVITNVTAQRTRRVDLVFGISYSDDIEKAERVLLDIIDKHEACLDDPAPVVAVHELGESSVNFIVRPWVKTTDYWESYWDLTKQVKLRFDAEGISIPFPQRDVHVIEQKS